MASRNPPCPFWYQNVKNYIAKEISTIILLKHQTFKQGLNVWIKPIPFVLNQ